MTKKVFAKGQLVELTHDVSPWENTLGFVLEDYPKEESPEYADTLVHVFYTTDSFKFLYFSFNCINFSFIKKEKK